VKPGMKHSYTNTIEDTDYYSLPSDLLIPVGVHVDNIPAEHLPVMNFLQYAYSKD